MSKRTYCITIHISRQNNILWTKSCIPYYGKPAVYPGDTIVYSRQKIVITAVRNHKRYSFQDILNNKQNSLYIQIHKSLLYLFAQNGKNIFIREIDIFQQTSSGTVKLGERKFDRHSQPLMGNFSIPLTIPQNELELIFDETDKAIHFRNAMTHYLCGISSQDRYFRFERLWRSFEQLAHAHSQPGANRPSEERSMVDMRAFIISNNRLLNYTLKYVARSIPRKRFRKCHWIQLIQNNYPNPGTQNQYNTYRDCFVLQNRDIRIIKMLRDTLFVRKSCLRHWGVYHAINSHLVSIETSPETHNDHVLAILLCKYAYYVRNKCFHGQQADLSFCFSDKTNDDDIIDMLNVLLLRITTELFISYSSL